MPSKVQIYIPSTTWRQVSANYYGSALPFLHAFLRGEYAAHTGE